MGGAPRSPPVGFWFSLGHATVVLALCALGVRTAAREVGSQSWPFR